MNRALLVLFFAALLGAATGIAFEGHSVLGVSLAFVLGIIWEKVWV
jgi:hypothetical protein